MSETPQPGGHPRKKRRLHDISEEEDGAGLGFNATASRALVHQPAPFVGNAALPAQTHEQHEASTPVLFAPSDPQLLAFLPLFQASEFQDTATPGIWPPPICLPESPAAPPWAAVFGPLGNQPYTWNPSLDFMAPPNGDGYYSQSISFHGPEHESYTTVAVAAEPIEAQENLVTSRETGCGRSERYYDPHKLPATDINYTHPTQSLRQQSPKLLETTSDSSSRPELLEVLDSQEDLAETAQSPSIRTPLAKHQRQALTFMLRREQGWAWDGSAPDIWEAVERGGEHRFVNRVSDVQHREQPPQFFGGIIADPMGLGKTLSMIALIASDMGHDHSDPSSLSGVQAEESSGSTLVIVPPTLLDTWDEQLKEHLVPGSLPWRRHHAKSRLTDASDLEHVFLVLTTYHTVSIEWRDSSASGASILFQTKWKRVILDEAHFIRNSDSKMARAICSLDSVSRWAVTGTPIQNKLGDLAALLKFLQAYPYGDKRTFESDISLVWKSGNTEEAVKRLKRLAGCLLLRRPKGIISLPPKEDIQRPVRFTAEEEQLYSKIRMQAIARIEEALASAEEVSTRSIRFVNVLQQIEAMRMVCNMGLYYPARHEILAKNHHASGQPAGSEVWSSTTAQQALNLCRQMGRVQCHVCASAGDAVDNSSGESAGQSYTAYFSRCLRLICPSCVASVNGPVSCGHDTCCALAKVSMNSSCLEEGPQPAYAITGNMMPLPTKVATLVTELRSLPGHVKSVVFSTWRMTLDIVEEGLKQASIPNLRLDGKVPQKERHGVVERFRNDPSIRVLLLTLSCGATGLTLTAASRAYLMEPHWNPTLEDQALARIHRMGQGQSVTTVRFHVQDSFEERVIEVQKSKRDLAGILLNPKGGPDAQSSGSRPLEWLRGLI